MSDHNSYASLIEAVLAKFPGAQIQYAGPARAPGAENSTKLLKLPYEYFDGFFERAKDFWNVGWPVFPQSRDGDSRRPSPCVKSYKHLVDKMPSKREQRDWLDYEPPTRSKSPNAALVIPKGHIVLDIDVQDPRADDIERIATEILGKTPLIRTVRGSLKRAMIFRTDSSLADRAKSAHKLCGPEGAPLLDETGHPLGYAIELLTPGSAITVWGRHWKSGQPFVWPQQPWTVKRSAVPVVTAEKLADFLAAVEEQVALLGKGGYDKAADRVATGEVSAAVTDSSGVTTPGNRQGTKNVTYGPTGLVTDGREAFVLSRSMRYAHANRALLATPAGRHAVAGALFAECRQSFDGIGNGRYSSWGDDGRDGHTATTSILQDCRHKIESAYANMRDRPDQVLRTVGQEENGKPITTVRTGVGIDRGPEDVLSWVETDAVSLRSITAKDQGLKALERRLRTDVIERKADQDRVAGIVRSTIDTFLDQCDAECTGRKTKLQDLLLLKAPVGAGKTSTAIERLAARPRRNKVVLFFLPSYANIDEAVERASKRKTALASAMTPTFRNAVSEAKAVAEKAGLKVGVLTGMERAGCLMKEQRAFLRQQGAPAHGLCEASVKRHRDHDAEKVFCNHHPESGGACPVIGARKALAECDVVFLPTAFLTIGLPEAFKGRVAGVVIDERCVFEILRYDVMPLGSLLLARPEPRILESDGENVTPQDLLMERERVAQFVHAALGKGLDPAQAIFDAGDETLIADVKSAKTVASRAQRSAMQIVPNLTMEYLQHVFTHAKADDLRQENKFWDIVLDRLAALRADALTRSLAATAGVEVDPVMLQARGERDARIQVLNMGEAGLKIRISWREDPILAELPTLLLDASADAAMVEKAWGGRDVAVVEIPAYLHLRTVVCLDSNHSTTSLVPSMNEPGEKQVAAGKKVRATRRAVNNIAHMNAGGRIAVASPMKARRAFQDAHAEAPNVDVLHLGAVRGLDFAKNHRAMVTIGRHEFPTWIVDAVAAALTYDDVVPETPFDKHGDGLDDAGDPISVPTVDRVLPLRDGRDLTIQVTEYPGRWGRSVQRQFREEELLQAMGRLRPVYRTEVGLWVAVSRIMPEGVVIDGVTTLKGLSSMKGAGNAFEAIRRAGIADPRVIARVAPDAGANLRQAGLLGTDTTSVMAKDMDVWSVTVAGETLIVQVPGYYERSLVASEIIEAYHRAGLRVETLHLVNEATGKTLDSGVKAPDKVDAEIGTREERRAMEEEARAAAREHAPEPERPFGPGLRAIGRTKEKADVEVAMILARQCALSPEDAAKAVVAAAQAPDEEEATAGPASLPAVHRGPGSPSARMSARAPAAASGSGEPSVDEAAVPSAGRPARRIDPGLARLQSAP